MNAGVGPTLGIKWGHCRLSDVKGLADSLLKLLEGARDVLAIIEDYIEERTERWQDSERGELFQEWSSSWEFISELVEEMLELATALRDALNAGYSQNFVGQEKEQRNSHLTEHCDGDVLAILVRGLPVSVQGENPVGEYFDEEPEDDGDFHVSLLDLCQATQHLAEDLLDERWPQLAELSWTPEEAFG